MRIAFKEWAVVVDALGLGQQIIILRKGGISEGRRGFQVDHAEFLLFPTQYHQHRDLISPEAQARFDELAGTAVNEDQVQFDYVAHVVSWRKLESLQAAERLRGQHIWRDEVIADRFEWGKEHNIYALAVRVFRLAAPVVLPVVASYGGCKSWIDLEQDVETEGATPVLSKEAFNDKLNQFHAALDSVAPENPPPLET
jgi:hypothetical protein